MKFIPPLEISSKIMTLIEEANKELILVSPYVEISRWDKMKKCLERAVKRDVNITFIARKNAKQDLSFLEQIGIKLLLINDLHAKLYLNEKYGIVTSQNVVYYSDINSIDIAYRTTDTIERKELVDFVNKYVVGIEPEHKNPINYIPSSNYDNLIQLKDWQLDKLYNHFQSKYNHVRFNCTSTYFFGRQLLPFAHVMISSVYVIKFKKSKNNCDELIEEISKLNFDLKNSYRIDLLTSHKTFYYLEFIPFGKFNFNKLILDFESITEKILKTEYNKNFTVSKENQILR